MKEENEKAGLKLNIKTMKFMASSPITSWWTEGGKVEGTTYFIFLGFKVTMDGDCKHEIKRHLLLGRKAVTNLDSVLNLRLLRVPWTSRRSNQSIRKGDQSWVFIGRTVIEAETPILWPPHAKS